MIFISYAKEDRGYAHRVYLAFKAVQLDPWMDKPPHPHHKDGLSVGQRWEPILQQKLAAAQYIVLVLSPRSVAKRGYVQVEFRTALDRMNYLPDNDILVLPILMEECEVPSLQVGKINLQALQWDVIPASHVDEFAQLVAELAQGAN